MVLKSRVAVASVWYGLMVAILAVGAGGFNLPMCRSARADEASESADEASESADEASESADEASESADEPDASKRVGWVFRVNLPIKGATLDRVRRFVRNAVDRAAKTKVEPVLIFEFVVPPDQAEFASSSEFGVSSDLADFVSGAELSRATTVAYVPQSIQGHAVLAVLACDSIAMSPEAEIGAAGIDERTITPRIHSTYEEIARRHKKIPTAVALGLVDPAKEVLVVETELGRECIAAEELEALRKRRTVQSDPTVLFKAGQPGRLSGKEARDLDIVDYLASNRRDLARMLRLPPEAIDEDPSLSGAWRAIRIDVKGPVLAASITQAQRMIEDAIRADDANFICLWIDSPGGSLADSIRLANFLAFDLDPTEVRTAAYIPRQALSDASLIALACDHVVMHPQAVLGGEGDGVFSEEGVRQARETLRKAIAVRKSRSWSLPAAMIDPGLEVFRYTRQGQVRYSEFFCEDEWTEQLDPDQWKKGPAVTTPGKAFQATGDEAVGYRLANEVVRDFGEFKAYYGLENDPTLLEPSWADFLIEALAHPGVAFFLLVIGFSAMYAELQAPGIGVGAFVALLCFLVFFWSRFLGGTAGWLEVLLFLAGVSCLLIEVFVLPGFGIFGLGGGLMVLASLVLASQTFVLPRNAYQMGELRQSLGVLAASAVAVIVAVVLINRWLPHVPVLGGMILQPPDGEEAEALRYRESLVHFENLLDARGTTTTQLTPSGKARFGDQLVDVMADGEVIPVGTEIVVVEVRGNRVWVRAVDERGPDPA